MWVSPLCLPFVSQATNVGVPFVAFAPHVGVPFVAALATNVGGPVCMLLHGVG